MVPPFDIAELEIEGYADVLKRNILPSVVPPVFHVIAQPERVLLPPYFINRGLVWNSTEVSRSELEELKEAGEVTLFAPSFRAQADYELWIDQSFVPHYEARAEVERELHRISDDAIGKAVEAMKNGDLTEAERLSSVALSANDRRVEPAAIKAAIRRIEGRPGERLMAELTSKFLDPKSFGLLVNRYYETAMHKKPVAPAKGSFGSPLIGLAARRSSDPVVAPNNRIIVFNSLSTISQTCSGK